MKAKPSFKVTPPPDLVGKGPAHEIRRAQLVAHVATRVPRKKDEDEKAFRNRISTNIYDAVKAGRLCESKPGFFRLGDAGLWLRAKSKWRKVDFDDIPVFPIDGDALLTLPRLRLAATGYRHPETLRAAIEEILVLQTQNRACAQALAAAEGRVRELEPDAVKWRNFIAKKKRKSRG